MVAADETPQLPQGASERKLAGREGPRWRADKTIKAHQEIGSLVASTERRGKARPSPEGRHCGEETAPSRVRYGAHRVAPRAPRTQNVLKKFGEGMACSSTLGRAASPRETGLHKLLSLRLRASSARVSKQRTATSACGRVLISVQMSGLYSNVAVSARRATTQVIMGAVKARDSRSRRVSPAFALPGRGARYRRVTYRLRGAMTAAVLDVTRCVALARRRGDARRRHSTDETTAGIAFHRDSLGPLSGNTKCLELLIFGLQASRRLSLKLEGPRMESAPPLLTWVGPEIGDDGRFGKNPAKMPGYNHHSPAFQRNDDKSVYQIHCMVDTSTRQLERSTFTGPSRDEVKIEAPPPGVLLFF